MYGTHWIAGRHWEKVQTERPIKNNPYNSNLKVGRLLYLLLWKGVAQAPVRNLLVTETKLGNKTVSPATEYIYDPHHPQQNAECWSSHENTSPEETRKQSHQAYRKLISLVSYGSVAPVLMPTVSLWQPFVGKWTLICCQKHASPVCQWLSDTCKQDIVNGQSCRCPSRKR